MTSFTLLQIIAGLVMLTFGAEALVRGASRGARLFGISPLVIGLTIVAYGTSMPELLVSVYASLQGNRDIAVANVVGSNIFNVLLILGICASIRPLVVAQQVLVREVPIMIAVSVITLLISLDGRIGFLEGLAFVSGVIGYTVFLVRESRKESRAVQEEYAEAFAPPSEQHGGWPSHLAWVAGGLVLLVIGARALVSGAVAIATAWGVSDLVIGLTIVAAGTSLPELATSVVAVLRNERDIAIGNVVGSNLYNLLAILGLSALTAPGGLEINIAVIHVDLPVMILSAFACLPFFFTGHTLARWEGGLFLGSYAAYLAYLILAAQAHPMLPTFNTVMLGVALPLMIVVIAIATWRDWRVRRHSSGIDDS